MVNLNSISRVGYGENPLEDGERVFLFWGATPSDVKKVESDFRRERYGTNIEKLRERVDYNYSRREDFLHFYNGSHDYSAASIFSVFNVPMHICCGFKDHDKALKIRNNYLEDFAKFLYKKQIVFSEMLPLRRTEEEEFNLFQAVVREAE